MSQEAPKEMKRHVVLSKQKHNSIEIFKLLNYQGLNRDKVIMYCDDKQFYELKRIPIEYGTWYCEPYLIQDGSFVISTQFDSFYIILHLLSQYDIISNPSFASEQDICLFHFNTVTLSNFCINK